MLRTLQLHNHVPNVRVTDVDKGANVNVEHIVIGDEKIDKLIEQSIFFDNVVVNASWAVQ